MLSSLSSSFPLTGGGFWVAFAQVALVYYGFAAAIHWVIPRFFDVDSVQVGERRPGQVKKEALLSIGKGALFFFFSLTSGFFSSSSSFEVEREKENSKTPNSKKKTPHPQKAPSPSRPSSSPASRPFPSAPGSPSSTLVPSKA
jgi:hypothetical protein